MEVETTMAAKKKRDRPPKPYTPLAGRKISIGGIVYKIKYFKNIEGLDPGDTENYDPDSWTAGWSDLHFREIGLFAYLYKEEHDYVLLHEFCHCCMEACKTGEMWQKEDFIKPFSRFMYDCLKQCKL
jgi:hypothetical protein